MTLAEILSLNWMFRAGSASSASTRGRPSTRASTRTEAKASAAGPAIAAFTTGQPVWTPRRYDKLAEEGYVRNVIAYRCIKEVAKGAASVPWTLFAREPGDRGGAGDRQLTDHPLLKLLAAPNPTEAGAAFWERLFIHQLIAGNSYLEAVRPAPGQPPRELWALRPDRVRVVPGERGLPAAYVYAVNNKEVRWPADLLTGKADVLHLKDAHPLNDWYGLSAIEAAAFSIDQHNAAGEHNAALLQSGARMSGVMTIDGEPSEEVVTRLQQLLLDRYQSPRNAGKPLVIGAAAKWQEMMLSPRDMDFNEMTLATARNICAAFGVPHVLVLPGEATLRNREDARLELWEQTILPRLMRTLDSLNAWLAPMFGPGESGGGESGGSLRIGIDLDQVSALIPRRAKHREAVVREYRAGLITLNEARAALQYAGLPEGDQMAGAEQPAPQDTPKNRPRKAEPWDRIESEKKGLSPEAAIAVAGGLAATEGLEAMAALLAPPLRTLALRVGESVSQETEAPLAFMVTPRFASALAGYGRRLVGRVVVDTQMALADSLVEGVEAGEGDAALLARLAQVFGETAGRKALDLSQREATHLAGLAAWEALKLAGFEEKEWLAALDGPGRGIHAELDGQVIPIDADFIAADGSHGPHPGALVAPMAEVVAAAGETGDVEEVEDVDPNGDCRCALIAPLARTLVEEEGGAEEEGEGAGEDTERPDRSPEARTSLWHRREALRQSLAEDLEDAFLLLFANQEALALEALEGALAVGAGGGEQP